MPKVTEEHRSARRHEIAGAAMRLFARKGFAATSVSDIIAESGLSAGAIYGHYKSKDDLIAAAVGELMDNWMMDIERARAPRPLLPPGELVRAIVSGALRESGSLSVLIQVWAQVAGDPDHGIPTGRVIETLRGILRDYLVDWYAEELGFSPADATRAAERFAPVYLGLVQGYIVQTSLIADFDGDAYLASITALTPDLARL
jgi:AcrR family transcriptional regulator